MKEHIKNEFNLQVNQCSKNVNSKRFTYASNDEGDNVEIIVINDVLIIGDIELHNKDTLIQKYNIPSNCSASEVIYYLYKKNDTKFIGDLIGDFSFVIYDLLKERTLAIRDHLGIKSLFWTKNNGGYVFASDIFLLQDLFDINDINLEYFKEYCNYNGSIDGTNTPFTGVYRVSSGCYIELQNNNLKSRKYWDLSDINEVVRHRNQNDYYEEFYSLLNEAVYCRLSDKEKNSVMLSGGLDSTSIYALSKIIEKERGSFSVSSVSAVFEELRECDESIIINELIDKYNSTGYYVNFDNLLFLNNFPNEVPFAYEPNVASISSSFMEFLIQKSASQGYSNVLTGYGGDQVMGGSNYITRDYLNKGEISKALTYITSYSIATNSSAFQNFIKYGLMLSEREEHIVGKGVYKRAKQIKYNHQKDLYYQIVNTKGSLYSDRVIGAKYGVNVRHPFLDRRLVEYMYKVPGDLRRDSTIQNKLILRESMNSILTKQITEKINKTTHLTHIYKSIKKNWEGIYAVISEPKLIEEIGLISRKSWHEELFKWRNGMSVSDGFWNMLSIEVWYATYQIKLQQLV